MNEVQSCEKEVIRKSARHKRRQEYKTEKEIHFSFHLEEDGANHPSSNHKSHKTHHRHKRKRRERVRREVTDHHYDDNLNETATRHTLPRADSKNSSVRIIF